ncbi:hypothetical protein GJAV_G00069380 [Gymnothorax javanicus]|nr:hypothetical protein GJAV_G00069380 [Gymnothorax javanicus]
MSIDCLRSSPEMAERTLTEPDHCYVSRKPGVDHGGTPLGGTHTTKPQNPVPPRDGLGQRKPRRKDTPILHPLPLIPGVRQLKGEKNVIHLEDEEKEGKI